MTAPVSPPPSPRAIPRPSPRSCRRAAAAATAARRSASCMSASRPRRPCRNSSASWREATGIAAWVGGVGLGVCAAGQEVYDRPAAAVLTRGPAARQLPPVRARPTTRPPICRATHAQLDRDRRSRRLALVHGDPRCPDLLRATVDAAAASGAFLVGGLMSHRCAAAAARRRDRRRPATPPARSAPPASAGLLLAPEVAVATGLTQGCSPIGPVRRIDEARDNVVMAIDGRPALAVFYEDIGPELAQRPAPPRRR